MKKGIWAIIVAIILALIAFLVFFRNNTDQKHGTIGAPIAFTLFYNEGDEAWMTVFEQQLEKWNNIHPVFSIEERIKITSASPIVAEQNDGINAVFFGELFSLEGTTALAQARTDTPTNGKLYGGDLAFSSGNRNSILFSELEKGECNVGFKVNVFNSGINSHLKPFFGQLALHELSHFIGLNHSNGAEITNNNLVIDPSLRVSDKKLWNMIAAVNFSKTSAYFDGGVFRGVDRDAGSQDANGQLTSAVSCPEVTPNAVSPNEVFSVKNVAIENLGSASQVIKVNYYMYPVNFTNKSMMNLGQREYQVDAYTATLQDVGLTTPSGFYSGEYYIKAVIEAQDDDVSNNQVILAKINILP